TGYDAEGNPILAPAGRWQLSVFRSGLRGDSPVLTRRIEPGSSEVRQRQMGGALTDGAWVKEGGAPDPTSHLTFMSAASRDVAGAASRRHRPRAPRPAARPGAGGGAEGGADRRRRALVGYVPRARRIPRLVRRGGRAGVRVHPGAARAALAAPGSVVGDHGAGAARRRRGADHAAPRPRPDRGWSGADAHIGLRAFLDGNGVPRRPGCLVGPGAGEDRAARNGQIRAARSGARAVRAKPGAGP